MADENLDLEDDSWSDSGSEEGKQKGKVGGKLVKVLAVVAGVVVATIFVVTVVVITVKIMERGTMNVQFSQVSLDYEGKPPILTYFDLIGQIRTSTADPQPKSIIVDVLLGYETGDQQLASELTVVYPRLKDFIRSYFSQKTVSELHPSRERYIKEDLKVNINKLLTGSISEVIFTEFQIY